MGKTRFLSQRGPAPLPIAVAGKQAKAFEDEKSSRDNAIQTLKSAGQRQSTKQEYVPTQGPLLSRKVKHKGRAIFDRSVDVDDDDEEEGEGQIIRYNESIIHLGSCTFVRGTVCANSYVWKQLGMLFAIAIGVALHTHWNGFLFIFPSEIIVEDYVPSEFALLDSILTLQSFLLGLCVSQALNRWWTIRDNCIGGLWGCIDDLCLVLGTTFAEQTNSSSLAHQRNYSLKERYLRLALASFALLFMEARGDLDGDTVTDVPVNAAFQGQNCDINSDTGKPQNSVASNERIALQVLVDRKLLSRKQADALEGECSKSQVIWCWIAHMFTVAQREGRLPDGHKLWWFHDKCTIARGSIGRTFAYIDTQLPLAYIHLLSLLVRVTLILMAVNLGFALVIFGNRSGAERKSALIQVCVEAFKVTLWNMVLQGMLKIYFRLSNPLSSNSVSLPQKLYHKIIRNEVLPPWRLKSKSG